MITQVDTNLWRGPRPENMDDLKALGIQKIINLEVGWFECFHGLAGREQSDSFRANIIYKHMPISDWMFPKAQELRNIEAEMGWFQKTEKTYIHCLHGQDRTGLACAIYRVKIQGWTRDDAIKEMYSMGFHSFPYKTPLGWEESLREYLK